MYYYRKLEIELDNNIEQEKQLLDRENIEADKAYKECFVILKDFDVQNHKCFKEVEYLLNVYADAAENVSNFFIINLFIIYNNNNIIFAERNTIVMDSDAIRIFY